MAATLRSSANDILNRVAAEVGLDTVPDPYGSAQQEFKQMRFLLDIAGEELSQLYQWEFLNKEHQITTLDTDSGDYDLPDDFLYMINQTGWERAENVPLYGPLSAQDWTYLIGRDLVSQTIYASFRLKQDKFSIFPQPPPNGLDINFEYISSCWVIDSTNPDNCIDKVKVGADTPMFDRTLISRYLKVKFLEAKGLDTIKAQSDLNQMFSLLNSHDKGSEILQAGAGSRSYPYLNGISSVGDSGYGL